MFYKSNKITTVSIFTIFAILLVFTTGCNVNKLKTEPDGDFDNNGSEADIESEIDNTFEQFVVGPNGGTYTSEDGVIIDVPIGAVDESTVIGIKKVTDKDTGDITLVSDVFEYAPAGLVFKKPVYITIPLTGTVTNSEYTTTSIYWTTETNDSVFEAIKNTVVMENSATATVNHFSFGFVGQQTNLPKILLKKWISAENSFIATNEANTNIFWSVSNAGLLLIDSNGTFEDQSDDSVIMHHEFTLENWPTESDIQMACSSTTGDNNILWISTQNELYLFDDNATPKDGSDDTLTLLANETSLNSSRTIKQLHCSAENTIWIGTNSGLVRIEINPEAQTADDKFIFDDFNATSTTKSSDNRTDTDGDLDDELEEELENTETELEEAAEIEEETVEDGDTDISEEEVETSETDTTEPLVISDMPKSDIRYSALSPDGTVWFSTFVLSDNSYHLFKMVPKTGSETGYSSLDEISFTTVETTEGQTEYSFVPKAMTVDKSNTLWIANEYDSKGFPVFYDADNQKFVAVSFSSKDNATEILSFGDHSVIVIKGSGDGFALADSSSKTSSNLDDFGINRSINRLISSASLSGKFFYSSQLDFGIIYFDESSFDGTFTRQRYIAPAGVPFNEIISFYQKENSTFIGGTNSVSQINYDTTSFPVQYSASSTVIEHPEEVGPFYIQSLSPLKSGMLVGGETLGFLDKDMQFNLWDNPQTPSNVSYAVADPDDNIWVNTMVVDLITLVSIRLYDYNNTETYSDDDSAEIVSNEVLGLESSAPLLAVEFYEHCRGIFANSLGLHYYDCKETPDTSDDDEVVPYILSSAVSKLTTAGDMAYWAMTLNGLTYIKFDSLPPAKNSDETYVFEQKAYKFSGMSGTFAYDKNTGYLYYFVKEGLVVHDPKGTPLDDTDDQVALFEMPSSRNANINIDNQGSLWFSYGDNSGIYHAIINEPEFKPLAEVLEAQ